METINDNNYELWLVRYADGELTAAEREAVEAWLGTHPEAAEELKLYGEAPRLEHVESVHYAATVPGRVQPLWPAVLRWSAVAAVVATLVVPAVRLLTPQEQSVEVAQADPERLPIVAEDSMDEPVESPVVERRNMVVARPQSEADPQLAESYVDNEPEVAENEPILPEVQPLLAEEVVMEEQEETIVESVVKDEPQLIYVDNLFVVDSGSVIEQRLLAVNETIKEHLQSTYLGRRLARRMPSDEKLLDYTDNLRERTPQRVRMMADMVLAYNESNK